MIRKAIAVIILVLLVILGAIATGTIVSNCWIHEQEIEED